MVTGRVPFEGKNPSAVMHKHLKEELVPPDHINPQLSAGCAQVIEMMMAKNASDRYRSATDLLQDLELVAKGQPPHFAHRSLDLSSVTPALTGPAPMPTVVPPQPRSGPTSSTMFIVVLVVMIISLLMNGLLFLLLFSS